MKYFIITLWFIIAIQILIYSQELNNSQVKVIIDTTIFPQGKVNACHASTIVETSNGKFMSAWFSGSYEGANDVGIWTSTFENNKWSEPNLTVEERDSIRNQVACWNPVLFETKNGRLILFYKVGINPREWYGMFIQSNDKGKTWNSPQNLPKGFLGPIKNKPIQIKNGNILCPSSIESIDGKWSIHLEITDENLLDWKKVDIEKDSAIGVIQPTILLHPNGKLQMLCRSNQNFIYETWSIDNGLSWSKLEKTSLPNPNSGIDAVALNDGRFVLVYNPLIKGPDWFNGRNILNVAISENGENWEDVYQLENEKKGEFSYPAIIQASDNSIQITYTYDRKTIKYIVLKY
jgi:predicted neuraminidase